MQISIEMQVAFFTEQPERKTKSIGITKQKRSKKKYNIIICIQMIQQFLLFFPILYSFQRCMNFSFDLYIFIVLFFFALLLYGRIYFDFRYKFCSVHKHWTSLAYWYLYFKIFFHFFRLSFIPFVEWSAFYTISQLTFFV